MADTSAYDAVIVPIVARFNPATEKGVIIHQLVNHAEMLGVPEGNIFLRYACERIGIQRIHLNRHPVVAEEGTSITVGVYDADGVIIYANKQGLRFLSELFRYVVNSIDEEEHINLQVGRSETLSKDSWPLSIQKIVTQSEIEFQNDDDTRELPEKKVGIGKVVAFQVFDDLPLPLRMTNGKVYKAIRIEEEWPEPTWGREPVEGEEGYYFVFLNDVGEESVIRLCLDDATVHLLTHRDLEQMS